MAKFTPTDEAQQVAEQERQMQLVLKKLAGNIQQKDFSNLVLEIKIDGKSVACEYRDAKFYNESGVVVPAEPGNIVCCWWKKDAESLAEAVARLGRGSLGPAPIMDVEEEEEEDDF